MWVLLAFSACGSDVELKGVRAAKTGVELTVSSVNSGTVKAEQEAELAFGTVGRVSKLNIDVGENVSKGTVLAELENGDLRMALEAASLELERYRALSTSRAVSKQELVNYQRAYELALGNYEKSLIRAPFDGLITEVNLEVGQLSQITAILVVPLIKLVDLAPRYVKAEIDEVDLGRLSVGLEARVKILAVRREPFKGKVRRVIPYISTIREQDRTSLIELDVDSEGQLLPAGASADIEIIALAKDNVLAIPSRTVLGRGSERYVYIWSDKKLQKKQVQIGIGNYDRSEVLSGILEGEIVIFPAEDLELDELSSWKLIEQVWP